MKTLGKLDKRPKNICNIYLCIGTKRKKLELDQILYPKLVGGRQWGVHTSQVIEEHLSFVLLSSSLDNQGSRSKYMPIRKKRSCWWRVVLFMPGWFLWGTCVCLLVWVNGVLGLCGAKKMPINPHRSRWGTDLVCCGPVQRKTAHLMRFINQ